MTDYLLLAATGLCIASAITVLGARLVDSRLRRLPLPLWFLVVSLTTPLVWLLLQAVILVCVLPDPQLHAGLARNWPLYFRDIVLGIGLKLWICGAVCTAALALFKRPSPDDPIRDAHARYGLSLVGGAIAASILVPMTMDYWIGHGRVRGSFALASLVSAFLVGLFPVIAASFAILRICGARAHLRYAEPLAALYAALIAWRAYVWYQAVADRPGASAVIGVGICALAGVCVGWLTVRRANQAGNAFYHPN